MTSLSRLFKDAKPQEAAMLPGNRFFVRRLSVEGDDIPGQVNLALEAISPFPLEQMLVGFVTSADGKQVLAYAAHRRRFTAEESFAWPEDCQVVPEFLALCGHRPAADGIVVHRSDERLTALAWKAGDEFKQSSCSRTDLFGRSMLGPRLIIRLEGNRLEGAC